MPERERTEPPPNNFFAMIRTVVYFHDREIIKKCGLDAYFFLRYLKTLLIIFIPICAVVLPILIPINYVGGIGKRIDVNQDPKNSDEVTGLDTLSWGNIRPQNSGRYAAHLVLAILVVIWICGVFFFELKAYIKVRQDYLTSAEHRLRASATTVLLNGIPKKWLSEEALRGLLDVFPGGVRNVWLNRDMTKLLDKVNLREQMHSALENAETELIKRAKKAQLKKQKSEEKKERKKLKLKSLSKQERVALSAERDKKAKELANSGEGDEAGDKDDVPHTVTAGVEESAMEIDQLEHHDYDHDHKHGMYNPLLGLSKTTSKVAGDLKQAAEKSGKGIDGAIGTTNGFAPLSPKSRKSMSLSVQRPGTLESHGNHSPGGSIGSATSTSAIRKPDDANEDHIDHGVGGNTVRKAHGEDFIDTRRNHFWQFWKPPMGGYASPVPQGPEEAEDYMSAGKKQDEKKTFWQAVKGFIPFMGNDDKERVYSAAFDHQDTEEEGAEWRKYLKKKHRPTHHLPLFGVNWMFGVPGITKKVDTIYYCRKELARLNLEIEEDQKHPENYPLMNSAFVQFNHQIAAHMACQSVVHHIPRHMAPRIIEISPRDVVWDNMAMSWWEEGLRAFVVIGTVCTMAFLWAIPVAWTAAVSQLDRLIQENAWLSFLKANHNVENFAKIIAGVLPAALLALLLVLVPLILNFLAGIRGAKTGTQKQEFVQFFYFIFLFLQVFLVVSIASFFAASLDKFIQNIQQTLGSVQSVLKLLADNLPKAANYFFSYMILQALTTSSGTLLQIVSLLMWFIIGPMFDSTARNKWARNTNLNNIQWGAFFPVYSNFACIAIFYSIISPLISIFAIVTFGLLWLAQRYAMIYVYRMQVDTGGVLYPRAINQTFTGLYFMQLCMAGLFFIVLDEDNRHPCITHGVIMLVVLFLTIIYQYLLNRSFSPLFRYLPVTFEDEAVLRDEAFQRAQDARLGMDEDDGDDEKDLREKRPTRPISHSLAEQEEGIELSNLQQEDRQQTGLMSLKPMKQVGTWAIEGGKHVGGWAKDGGNQLLRLTMADRNSQAAQYRRQQRKKDLEAQRAMGNALFGGVHDEIEDLTPDERDMLTRHAFLHSALRARRPAVWIPRDDLGISEDEIKRTEAFSKYIWISNEGTALDSKTRVIYGKHPPDFSEVDLINL